MQSKTPRNEFVTGRFQQLSGYYITAWCTRFYSSLSIVMGMSRTRLPVAW